MLASPAGGSTGSPTHLSRPPLPPPLPPLRPPAGRGRVGEGGVCWRCGAARGTRGGRPGEGPARGGGAGAGSPPSRAGSALSCSALSTQSPSTSLAPARCMCLTARATAVECSSRCSGLTSTRSTASPRRHSVTSRTYLSPACCSTCLKVSSQSGFPARHSRKGCRQQGRLPRGWCSTSAAPGPRPPAALCSQAGVTTMQPAPRPSRYFRVVVRGPSSRSLACVTTMTASGLRLGSSPTSRPPSRSIDSRQRCSSLHRAFLPAAIAVSRKEVAASERRWRRTPPSAATNTSTSCDRMSCDISTAEERRRRLLPLPPGYTAGCSSSSSSS
mmetsp:Transcript_26087/g.65606  ORF Transcript_26087/g.65606 Transcript_26087/m.65606 type:complete len:329 (+) Transcript_26087:641-1627(+)